MKFISNNTLELVHFKPLSYRFYLHSRFLALEMLNSDSFLHVSAADILKVNSVETPLLKM